MEMYLLNRSSNIFHKQLYMHIYVGNSFYLYIPRTIIVHYILGFQGYLKKQYFPFSTEIF